jgi:hypothetical protein
MDLLAHALSGFLTHSSAALVPSVSRLWADLLASIFLKVCQRIVRKTLTSKG